MITLPLTVCMIARDEEHALPRALSSVLPFASQIVVCDTGSTDRTAAIAGEAGALVLRVPWQEDFAAARNVALGAATSPWILSLDADEELLPDSVPALRHALGYAGAGQLVHIHLLGAPSQATPATGRLGQVLSALRLFRSDPGIRFRGRVHETVAESLLHMGQTEWPDSGVYLAHHGYAAEAERQRKSQRNLRLLRLAHAEAPGDLFIGYKLALTLPQAEREDRLRLLRDLAVRALALPEAERATYPFLGRLVAACCDELLADGQLAEAGQVALLGAERLGPGAAFTAGRVLMRVGQPSAAEEALRRYLDAPVSGRHTGLLQADLLASPERALHLLGRIALKRGQAESARSLLQAAAHAAGDGEAQGTLRPANDHRGALRCTNDHRGSLRCAIQCDLLRVQLRAGQVQAAAAALDALGDAAQVPELRREVMLVSAELSLHIGDADGALPLLQAAVDPRGADERGAALLAALLLERGDRDGALALLPALPGADHESQAVRRRLLEVADPRGASRPAT